MAIVLGVMAFALLPRVSPPNSSGFHRTALMLMAKELWDSAVFYKVQTQQTPNSLQLLVEKEYLKQVELDRVTQRAEIAYYPENLENSKPDDAIVVFLASKERVKKFFIFPTKTPKFTVTVHKNGNAYIQSAQD